MREISRIALYEYLIRRRQPDVFMDIISYNYELIYNIEEMFLTDDLKENGSYNSQREKENLAVEEILIVLRNNIENIKNNEGFQRNLRIQESILAVETIISSFEEENRKRRTAKGLFNKLINELCAVNSAVITRGRIPNYMQRNEEKIPQVFLSHAYDDKLYTYALFEYFYRRGVYLYVDWMHRDNIDDGKKLKQDLHEEIINSSQLLFMRTLNSELNIQGKQAIRSWCAWELGDFYSSIGIEEKFFFNLYSTDNYSSQQLHGMKLFTGVKCGRLQGVENEYPG